MSFCRTRHRSSISRPFESFIIQKTKQAPPSCPMTPDGESRGRRGEGLEAGAGVQPESLVLGRGPFSSVSACGMKVSTLSSFDRLAENDCICGCFFFLL